MDYKIKLGAVIEFNEEKEKDIIEAVESLRDRHKLGDFISYAIRISLEHPEWFDSKDVTLASFGLTDTRRAYFESINSRIKAMEQKVDTIYNMGVKVYTLAKFGKRIGIEKKAENTLQAGFLLQKQLDEIATTLGVSSIGHVYESNKMDTLSKKVDELLEYIIESYDSIVLELKNNVIQEIDLGFSPGMVNTQHATMQQIHSEHGTTSIKQGDTESTQKEPTKTDIVGDSKNADELSKDKESENLDEVINFGGGDVDLSLLEGFFPG